MKLRLRSLQSKETVKLDVSDQCTLQQLKEILSGNLPSSSLLASSSLRFSLNREAELSSSSPQDSLLSIGVASGDLIYFSINPNEFSSSSALAVGASSEPSFQAQAQQGNLQSQSMSVQDSENFDSNTSRKPETLVQVLSESGQTVYPASDVNLQESDLKECEISQESEVVDQNCKNQQTKYLGMSTSNEETLIKNLPQSEMQEENLETRKLVGEEDMDIDTISANADGKRISEPNFLKRVLREEIGDDFSDNKLLFIAIHAAFLESGFVGFDSVSGLRVDLFHLLQEKPLMTFTTCVSYTLPELLSDGNVAESIVLKFQTLGHYVNVYGSLANSPSGVHKLNLDKCKFVPTIGMVWATFDNRDRLNEMDGSSLSYAESVVFEFWKTVKDQLALPLLIDLCEKTGLSLPPCLMLLPADLKLRLLESLPGQYIARMACVCKEMQYLSSNNDLWKEKYAEEFGSGTGAQGSTNWKTRFISSWEKKNKRKGGWTDRQYAFLPIPFSGVRYEPLPFGNPHTMIGGHNRLSNVSGTFNLGQLGVAFPRIQMRRNFAPNCNPGGFSA